MKVLAGIYSQLPSGTGALVLERVLSCVLKPMLTFLYNHPDAKVHLHLTTAEMEWLECNHPEVNMLITDLAKKNQLELLTGGYYQPILQLLQMKDRSSQIEKTTTYIRRRYGMRVQTLWCYDQIWNPSYISAMNLCSTSRLMISTYDRLNERQLRTEPFIMQETGRTIEVYPTDDFSSRLISEYAEGRLSFNEVRKRFDERLGQLGTTEYFSMMINADHLCQGSSLCGHEAEQSGVWKLLSDLYDACMDKKWNMLLLNEYDEEDSISNYDYLPAGWYGRDSRQTKKMSSFNDILVQSEELNQLYGRLLFIQDVVRNYKKNKDIRKRAESLLEKASSGVPYITDSSGGSVQPMYRKLVYKYLNEVEQLLSSQPDFSYPIEFDVDFDQREEYLSLGKNISAMVDSKGGAIIELNYLPAGWNYADTFSGRPVDGTAHGHGVVPGRKQKVFEDILFPIVEDFSEYRKYDDTCCASLGSEYYDLDRLDRKGTEYKATYLYEGAEFFPFSIAIEKKYKFRQNTIIMEVQLTNESQTQADFIYGSELNISVGTRTGAVQLYAFEAKHTELLSEHDTNIRNLRNIRMFDEVNKTIVSLTSDNRFSLVKEDCYTESPTVLGKELLYHHTSLLPYLPVHLNPQESTTFKLALRIERR